MLAFLAEHYAVIITVLFMISEALGAIPSVKQSAVYQVVLDLLKFAKDKLVPKQPPAPPAV